MRRPASQFELPWRRQSPRRHRRKDLPTPRAGIPLEDEATPHTGDTASVFHCRRSRRVGSEGAPMMSLDQSVHRVAIVGTGVIGASWAAYYLSRGFDVVATDPGPQSEPNLPTYVND